jgi:hypothetical protein
LGNRGKPSNKIHTPNGETYKKDNPQVSTAWRIDEFYLKVRRNAKYL